MGNDEVGAMGQSAVDQQARIVTLEAEFRQTRHDIRSALVPAMLAADMMRTHADPKVRESGNSVVRSVERVLARLNAASDLLASRP